MCIDLENIRLQKLIIKYILVEKTSSKPVCSQ